MSSHSTKFHPAASGVADAPIEGQETLMGTSLLILLFTLAIWLRTLT